MDESLATYRMLLESASRSRDTQKQLRFALSCRDVRMYFTQKYPCPAHIRKTILESSNRILLSFAYQAFDFQVAKDAAGELRKLDVELSTNEHLLLFGSHPVGGLLFRPLIRSKQLLIDVVSSGRHRLKRLLCLVRAR
jgi:hypothetical protein